MSEATKIQGPNHPEINRPNEIYNQLFRSDPLLLKTKSQKEYVKHLVGHTLGFRSKIGFSSSAIDLHNETSVEQLKWQATSPPDVTPQVQQAIQDYIKCKAQRKPLSETAQKLLKPFIKWSNGEKTSRRGYNSDRPLPEFKGKSGNNKILLAAVGLRVTISTAGEQVIPGENLCLLPRNTLTQDGISLNETDIAAELGRTDCVHSERLKTWQNQYLECLKRTLDAGAQIICFPEFALPPDSAANSMNETIAKLLEATENDLFLFAGSRHQGLQNAGLIYCKKAGTLSKPMWHYKIASSRGLGENILGPRINVIPRYVSRLIANGATYAFEITVAICYDAFDPTVFLSLLRQSAQVNDSSSICRLILVPSFNPSSDFVALLRDLSFLARCSILYVDALHGEAKMYTCGFDIADFAAESDANSGVDPILAMCQDELNNLTGQLGYRKIEALEVLISSLQELKSDGGLDNNVSFHNCPSCTTGHDEQTELNCWRDILFLEIDWRLIAALETFRSTYFDENEMDLPFALQTNYLASTV